MKCQIRFPGKNKYNIFMSSAVNFNHSANRYHKVISRSLDLKIYNKRSADDNLMIISYFLLENRT